MTRQEANRQILALLSEANELLGDQRFGQLLLNLGVSHSNLDGYGEGTVSYWEESTPTLRRVSRELARIKEQLNDKV